MTVECIDIKKANKELEFRNLTIGKEYLVLSIEFYESTSLFSSEVGDFVAYRILDNNRAVMLFPARNFKITLPEMPSCWVTFRQSDGTYSILPKGWAREYFWDDFYNDEEWASEEFEVGLKEMSKMM